MHSHNLKQVMCFLSFIVRNRERKRKKVLKREKEIKRKREKFGGSQKLAIEEVVFKNVSVINECRFLTFFKKDVFFFRYANF